MTKFIRSLPWAWVSRLVLAFGQIVPGLILFIVQSNWTLAGTLGAWSAIVPIPVFGLAMVVGGVMVLIKRTQDIGLLVGAITWGLLGCGYFVTLAQGVSLSPLGVGAYPATVLAFLWATNRAVEAHVDSEHSEHRGQSE